MKKRLIEYDLPLAEISEESAKEKNIRHGHPSTQHIWWARRYGDDYWLHIVTHARTGEPELQRIKNLVVHFQMDEDIFAPDYIIPEHKWQANMHIHNVSLIRGKS